MENGQAAKMERVWEVKSFDRVSRASSWPVHMPSNMRSTPGQIGFSNPTSFAAGFFAQQTDPVTTEGRRQGTKGRPLRLRALRPTAWCPHENADTQTELPVYLPFIRGPDRTSTDSDYARAWMK
jgi:hypothetical protein